jgi:hypothetical protein
MTTPHSPTPTPAPNGRGGRTALVAALLGGAALLAVGTVPRVLRHRAIVAEAGATTTAVPVVTVAEARLGAASGELALPATAATTPGRYFTPSTASAPAARRAPPRRRTPRPRG